MSAPTEHECTVCGAVIQPQQRDYRAAESGLSDLVLHGIDIADCPHCGNQDIFIPRMAKIQRAIANALVHSPARLTGEQFRFLRTHLALSGAQLGTYFHADPIKVSKWEDGKQPIGVVNDRLIRLLAVALDPELRPEIQGATEHLPGISDRPGRNLELHIDAETLQYAFLSSKTTDRLPGYRKFQPPVTGTKPRGRKPEVLAGR